MPASRLRVADSQNRQRLCSQELHYSRCEELKPTITKTFQPTKGGLFNPFIKCIKSTAEQNFSHKPLKYQRRAATHFCVCVTHHWSFKNNIYLEFKCRKKKKTQTLKWLLKNVYDEIPFMEFIAR